jgi:hypothetical protein
MKTLILALFVAVSAAALGQSTHDSDVACLKLTHLEETACTFGDGSGEVLTDSSVSHYSAAEWTDALPVLIKAEDDARAARTKANEELLARTQAEFAKDAARVKAEDARAFFTTGRDKKGCVRAGYAWQHGECVDKDTK